MVIPPLRMAGPILFKLLTARSSLVPGKKEKKIILDNRASSSKAKDASYTIEDKNLDNTKNTKDSIQEVVDPTNQ